ncbi:hypothetical protein AAG570_009788 [Ranatra chinensis]|uniref:Uncharacterized protein n=1 Tax=Ranatra chinensis TaxID=642074 RepID=A0ABD0YQ32_9HEMI
MDPNDSKMIYRYLDKLIDETPDFEDILNALIKKKMFSPSMVSHIKSGETDRVRLTKLYEMVPKRGPEAFRNLISALEEVGCIELSQILSGKKIVVINSQKYLDTNKEEEFKEQIMNFSMMKEHADADSAVVVVMTHGGSGSNPYHIQLETSDGLSINSEWILEQFTDAKCPNLRSKPKIFIFDCCRGKYKYNTRIQYDGSLSGANKYLDMLIVYSSIPEFTSSRNADSGTVFSQRICQVFSEHAHSAHITDMLHQVVNELQDTQVPCFESRSFDKKLYFNPGL